MTAAEYPESRRDDTVDVLHGREIADPYRWLEDADSGTVRVGDTVRLSYVDQNRAGIDPKKNVWEAISDGEAHIRVGNIEIPSRAYVAAFGFKGSDQQKPAGVMSGGERNRMNLALTLKQGGNLLLLDEPTNDLDTDTLRALEEAVLSFAGALTFGCDHIDDLAPASDELGEKSCHLVGYLP